MSAPLRLLFVCVENSCRSQMAGAFARVRDQIEARVRALLAGGGVPAARGRVAE